MAAGSERLQRCVASTPIGSSGAAASREQKSVLRAEILLGDGLLRGLRTDARGSSAATECPVWRSSGEHLVAAAQLPEQACIQYTAVLHSSA
jgi:hypothetical protein